MKLIKKIFGEKKISWKFLILFSTFIGVIVGILNRIPILKNTSFQDISIYLEMWIILAIFIIINCKNWKEAVSKCFIFFLISQPLIYLTEIIIDVIFKHSNFLELFIIYFKNYYIGNNWLLLTFLTIPGAYIAYQVKNNNILSSLILSIATCYLSFVGTKGLLNTLVNSFPYHLLNSIITLGMAYILIFTILKNKKERIISLILTLLVSIIAIILFINTPDKPLNTDTTLEIEDNIIIVDAIIENPNIADIILEEDGKSIYVYTTSEVGETRIIAKDSDNNEYIYIVTSTKDKFKIEKE